MADLNTITELTVSGYKIFLGYFFDPNHYLILVCVVLPGGTARGGCAGTGGRGASGGVAALQRVRALRNARRAARYARGPTAARLGHASRPLRLE